MLYLLALVCPPLAVLCCGKPVQALVNILLSFLLYVPGVIHACLVAQNYYADQRQRRLERVLFATRPPPYAAGSPSSAQPSTESSGSHSPPSHWFRPA